MNVGDRVMRLGSGPDSPVGTVVEWGEVTQSAHVVWEDAPDAIGVHLREHLVLYVEKWQLPESRDRAAIDRWLDA